MLRTELDFTVFYIIFGILVLLELSQGGYNFVCGSHLKRMNSS